MIAAPLESVGGFFIPKSKYFYLSLKIVVQILGIQFSLLHLCGVIKKKRRPAGQGFNLWVMNKQDLVFAKLVEIATAYFSEGKYVVCGALVDFINANNLCSPEKATVLAVAVWNEVEAQQKPFLPGDLVINFGAVCVVEGYNHGDCLLKIVLCTKDGILQGGYGKRYCAPPKNCRLVTNADNVRLKHFAQ